MCFIDVVLLAVDSQDLRCIFGNLAEMSASLFAAKFQISITGFLHPIQWVRAIVRFYDKMSYTDIITGPVSVLSRSFHLYYPRYHHKTLVRPSYLYNGNQYTGTATTLKSRANY